MKWPWKRETGSDRGRVARDEAERCLQEAREAVIQARRATGEAHRTADEFTYQVERALRGL